jgi:DNA polymerase zeta
MPKVQRIRNINAGAGHTTKNHGSKTMESYMSISTCVVCRVKLSAPTGLPSNAITLPLCTSCAATPSLTLHHLRENLRTARTKKMDIDSICRSCADVPNGDEVKCDSRDCPVFYSRVKATAKYKVEMQRLEGVIEAVEAAEEKKLREMFEW